MNMTKLLFAGLIALIGLVSVSSAFAAKHIVYNGIECAYRNYQTASSNQWAPSFPGLYGNNVSANTGGTICPIVQQAAEGYNFSKLSYVLIEGFNITVPRLCRRGSNYTVVCGTAAPIGSDAWILYKPAGGGQYDDAFLHVKVGSGLSLIREYTVVWIN